MFLMLTFNKSLMADLAVKLHNHRITCMTTQLVVLSLIDSDLHYVSSSEQSFDEICVQFIAFLTFIESYSSL